MQYLLLLITAIRRLLRNDQFDDPALSSRIRAPNPNAFARATAKAVRAATSSASTLFKNHCFASSLRDIPTQEIGFVAKNAGTPCLGSRKIRLFASPRLPTPTARKWVRSAKNDIPCTTAHKKTALCVIAGQPHHGELALFRKKATPHHNGHAKSRCLRHQPASRGPGPPSASSSCPEPRHFW